MAASASNVPDFPICSEQLPNGKREIALFYGISASHGISKRDYVPAMALAALAAGADGLLIEVHPDPDRALSDGAQSLNFEAFTCLLSALRRVAEPLGKTIN